MITPISDQILHCPPRPFDMDRRWKSNIELAPNCPRCASPNTKFCYYNNYSLSQPRYFCKGCRRYWTKGGSLRNVPIGGGCRKNRRVRSVRSSLQIEQIVGITHVYNPPSPGRSCSDSLTGSLGRPNGSSDIDLAEVFAKYLNQNSGSGNNFVGEESSSGANCGSINLRSSSLDVEAELKNLMIECQMPSDPIDNVQELMGHDPNAFGLQPIMSDELIQDVSWSDGPTWPNFGLQPMVQLQEFGSFLADDQLNNSTNTISNNRSSFDQLGYEIFSRP